MNVLILQVCWVPLRLLMRDQETEAALANMGPLPEFRKVSLPPGTHPPVGWDAAGFQASRGPDSRNPNPVNTPHSGPRGHLVKPPVPPARLAHLQGLRAYSLHFWMILAFEKSRMVPSLQFNQPFISICSANSHFLDSYSKSI